MPRVSIEIENHIARVTMTRGDKMNGIDAEMAQALVEAGHSLMDNQDIRVVVLSGEGRAFCAGLDVASFAMLASQDPEQVVMPRSHGNSNIYQEICLIWRKLPVPVIAALHGAVFGGGFQIALGADIRIAHPDSKLSVMEMKWGLVPDMGGMVLLPRLTRSDVLRRLTYTNEQITAKQALDWGLVTELAEDPQAAAIALATVIANKSPSAIRAAKRLIDVAENADEDSVLMAESRAQADLIGQPDQLEVIASNLQKRAPVFN